MSRRILVADDSSTIQKVIKIAFARHNVEIVEASSFIEALATSTRQSPHLLIVDASLPGAKGPSDFAKLVSDARNVPVLLLFGTYDAVDEAAFRQAGLPHFLKKPFESGDLLALADRLLGGELTKDSQSTRRDVPTMPPAPDQPLPAGRVAHTTVIYEPGTFPLREGSQAGPGQPPPGPRRAGSPPPRPAPRAPALDLDAVAPAAEDVPQPKVLTDDTQRGRRAFVPDPPVGSPLRGPAVRNSVPPPPFEPDDAGADRAALTDEEARFEAELERLGVPPPSPQAPGRAAPSEFRLENVDARSMPAPGSRGDPTRPMPQVPADLGRAPESNGGREATVPPGFRQQQAAAGPRGPAVAIGDDELLALLDERLPALARQAIEDYCDRHFKSLAREIIATELRRLADEKARHLVDN